MRLILKDSISAHAAADEIMRLTRQHPGKYEVLIEPYKAGNRTDLQNRSMHKYFEMLAEALNDAGWDMKRTLKEEVSIPWTKESVKNHLWRPVQEVMLDKESTTELDTADPNKVYEVVSRHIAEKTGVHVEWPCRT